MSENDKQFRDDLLEVFLFETTQLVEQLEELLIDIEEENHLNSSMVNEIFRIMHTIKGSSAMMMYDGISKLAHCLESAFDTLRNDSSIKVDLSLLTDIVLQTVDFIKDEVNKIQNGKEADGDSIKIIKQIEKFADSGFGGELKVKQVKEQEKVKIKTDNKDVKKETKNRTIENEDIDKSIDKTDIDKSINKNLNKSIEADTDEIKKEKECLPQDSCLTIDGDLFYYKAKIRFQKDCQMENMRAYTLVHQIQPQVEELAFYPSDILENESTSEYINENGFYLEFSSIKNQEEIMKDLEQVIFVENIELDYADHAVLDLLNRGILPEDLILNWSDENDDSKTIQETNENDNDKESIKQQEFSEKEKESEKAVNGNGNNGLKKNSLISVNVNKMDTLMDLVGELVIAEAMVARNPDLEGLELENFNKATRQLSKLTNELQDIVMSMRLIPIASTFNKMQRIVRDMKRKLGKEVDLELIGEGTEIDKNIAELISDPLMHIIRNALDHGIEDAKTRVDSGKPETGKIYLEAKNAGGDIWINVRDDGKGLDPEILYNKAKSKGIVDKAFNEYSEKEILAFILLPGFSTKDEVSEFSGRGVGMDVVRENISKLSGSIMIESKKGFGTHIRIRIPMTLAIIDGMVIGIGDKKYIMPTTSIRESFRATEKQLFNDSQRNEMIMIRGQCYTVLRLHEKLQVDSKYKDLTTGIIVVVEEDDEIVCLFADELLGKQQVVVKPIPGYIKKAKSIAGCTILGDGSISLILDAKGLIDSDFN